MKVFLNPGHHPGVDPGAVNSYFKITEAAIVEEVGAKVEEYLKAAGCEVMSIQSDNLNGEEPEYPCVCQTANSWNADIFVSIHCNAAVAEARGTETLVYTEGGKSEVLAKFIQDEIVGRILTVDRGIKERPNLSVLRNTFMPAVLVELAFISNSGDANLLIYKKEDFAKAIAVGITNYWKWDITQQ